MNPKEKKSSAKHEPKNEDQPQSEMGGREFGNVIEPTQAQMASSNKGLAGDTDEQTPEKKPRKRGKNAA